MGKEVGTGMAKQNSKGGPRDGNAENRSTPKEATRSPYSNPANNKGDKEGLGENI
uniref:Uncharacterized protein n=1 Tax=viral metagenome TaxID=1070528 RepID=A0A6M3KJB9_9ZZZZ